MPNPNESPAVKSLKREQAAERKRAHKGDLDKALEDTFPASDPVSVIHTAVPAGRTDTEEANRVRAQSEVDNEFPLVEQALRSTRDRRHSDDGGDEDRNKIRALRRHADRIVEASKVAFEAPSPARAEVRSFVREFEDKIRERPIAAVAVVAALAFVFGATR